jgi:hypothetical protein
MCPLLVPLLIGFFLLRPLTVLMKQARQAVCAVKQSILLRCLWMNPWELFSDHFPAGFAGQGYQLGSNILAAWR